MQSLKTYFFTGLLLLIPLFIVYQILSIIASVTTPFIHAPFLLNVLLSVIIITLIGWTMINIFKRKIKKHLKHHSKRRGIFATIASLILEFDTLSDKTRKAFRHPVLYKIDDGIYQLGYITNKDVSFLSHTPDTAVPSKTDTETNPATNSVWVYTPSPVNFFGNLLLIERRKIRILQKEDMHHLPLFILSAGLLQKQRNKIQTQ